MGSQAASKRWAVLFYLSDSSPSLQDIVHIGASPQMAIAIQQNHSGHAERYLLSQRKLHLPPPPVQKITATHPSDPIMLADFLQWGLEACPAAHVAVIFVNAGIANFQHPASKLVGHSVDSNIDLLYLHQVLAQVLSTARHGHTQLDLLAFTRPTSQFIETAYQLADVTHLLVGPQANEPTPNIRLSVLLPAWQQQLQHDAATGAITSAAQLAALTVEHAPNLSALNLKQLDNITRAFDTLTMALLQSLGDDIIWKVVWDETSQTLFNFLPAAGEPTPTNVDLNTWLAQFRRALNTAAEQAIPQWYAKKLEKLPPDQRADLRQAVGTPHADPQTLERAITAYLNELPSWTANDFQIIKSQQQRAANLAELADRALALLEPGLDRFILAHTTPSTNRHGVSIYLPTNLDRLTETPYLSLAFNQQTHWIALLGAINLIARHPRALWRLASSMLTTAGGAAREDLLRRLIGPDSVMVGFRQQFRALASPARLTLSLEPHSKTGDGENAAAEGIAATQYRLHLESHEIGATVLEQNSRVNPQTIDAALTNLEQLLQRGWATSEHLHFLESLGRTLGEDIIQNLADALNNEYRQLAWLGTVSNVPHLQIQLPRQLMRYPWELLHDGYGLLCERYALGRQVFMEVGLAKPIPPRLRGSIRALIIGDPLFTPEYLAQAAATGQRWVQLPGAQEEAEQVAQTFEQLAQIFGSTISFSRNADTRIHRKLTKLEFRDLLRNGHYDIIHFAGHALFDPDHPEQSAWLLSDGPLWAQEIRNTLARVDSPPWLVFANACESAMDSGRRTNRYQGDVFGLATAFINQGVAAYIGPLWPVNDTMAAQMATDFYYALLLEHASLGEALRYARLEARRVALGNGNAPPRDVSPLPTQIGLGWASFALYGDPSARLLESLWTPHHLASNAIPRAMPDRASKPHRIRIQRPVHPVQAPVEDTLALVAGPGMAPLPADAVRGTTTIPAGQQLLELVEVNGIRHWQTINHKTRQRVLLAGSAVAALSTAPDTRRQLGLARGAKDYARILGRWLFHREEGSLIEKLVAQYDRDVVPKETLWLLQADGSRTPLEPGAWWWFDGNTNAETDRVLLILHGTFSSTAAPIAGLGKDFLRWATRYYRGVIAFDHWTLSKSPLDNARNLWDLLDGNLRQARRRLDIVAHSRGGLVARAMIELERHHRVANRVVFVSTPNSGATLADPTNWGHAADNLVNVLHLDKFGIYGRLSSLLARLVINQQKLEQRAKTVAAHIPGVQAQNPRAMGPDDFLGMLQRGNGPASNVIYAGVAANYEPRPEEITLKNLFKATSAKIVDAATDSLVTSFNDLVVDTAHVWAVDTPVGLTSTETVPWLPAENLLVYNPGQQMKTPPGAISLNVTGVHHTNIFYYRQTRNFLRDQLSRP